MDEDLTKLMPSSEEEAIPPCGIYVDEEGDWYHGGSKIFRENILDLFYENLCMDRNGAFLIQWRGKRCILDTADTPFVISGADRKRLEENGEEKILLSLRHRNQPELLDPSTLWVGKDHVLYCRIREGLFPARFSRPAYYQLAEWIREDSENGGFYLELNGKRYDIRLSSEA